MLWALPVPNTRHLGPVFDIDAARYPLRQRPPSLRCASPLSESGRIPACSSASQATSSSSRCWGSIVSASRGAMPKKSASKSGDVGEEAAPFGLHPPRGRPIGVVVRVGIPAVVRHLGDGVVALDQQLPEALRPRHIARQPATDPDHRHRFGNVGRERGSRTDKFTCEYLARLWRHLGRAIGQTRHYSLPPVAASSSLAATRSDSNSISSSDSSGSASDVC